jgi:hypothetical protein
MRSNDVVLMTVVGHRVALGLVLDAMADRLGWGAATRWRSNSGGGKL